MKKLFLYVVFFVLLVFVSLAQAASTSDASFSWTKSIVDVTHDAATGYEVHCGPTSGNYTLFKDAGGAVAYIWTGLASGDWYCAAKAYNAGGKSGFSSEVMKTVLVLTFPPNDPTYFDMIINSNMSIKVIINAPGVTAEGTIE